MSDSPVTTFEQALAEYATARAEARAAQLRADNARRAVVRARPAGVTTLEVARRLRDVQYPEVIEQMYVVAARA